VEIP
jgi:hypothetical protein